MILYLAGNLSPALLATLADRANAKNFLETFAHKGSRETAEYFADNRFDFKLFIDSGAFTAWRSGKPIVLSEYIAFCKNMMVRAVNPAMLTFAALDVIAGSASGVDPTPADFEVACRQGWANYLEMKAQGVQSLPTFHQGDEVDIKNPNWKWLETLVADTDYIALAPRKVGKTNAEKMEWLNECFKWIDAQGMLRTLKIHGLGISSPTFLESYPFYSVDSTRWLQGGRANAFRWFNGYRDYMLPPADWQYHLSTRTCSCIPAIHRYRAPGEASSDGEVGSYWFATSCVHTDVQIGNYITEHWKQRGVDWKHED